MVKPKKTEVDFSLNSIIKFYIYLETIYWIYQHATYIHYLQLLSIYES